MKEKLKETNGTKYEKFTEEEESKLLELLEKFIASKNDKSLEDAMDPKKLSINNKKFFITTNIPKYVIFRVFINKFY